MSNFDNFYAMQWYEQYQKKHKPKGYLLWVDDMRGVPNHYIGEYHIIIARSYEEAVVKVKSFSYSVICLDHDLGEEKTGYDLCKYIIENRIHCPEYRIHTSNPVGRKNMTELLRKYTDAVIKQC